MKIMHLSIDRELTPGQVKQLSFESEAALNLEDVTWATLAYHNGDVTASYMRQIPRFFRTLFMRKLWAWIVLLRISRSYDFILMRHMTFDPVSLIFAPFVSNRISVHHSKEIEELKLIRKGWKGIAASWLEKKCGAFSIKKSRMILGVTQEIAEYERDLRAPGKMIGVYPNGIDTNKVTILNDKRFLKEIHAAFICGTFSQWHGLDKLIAATKEYDFEKNETPMVFHIIGNLNSAQKEELEATELRRRVFKIYGLLDEEEYRSVLEKCDFGIASLAMERQNLTEGSTLKVREMLALGLPIYSGHKGIALDESQKWIKIGNSVCIQELYRFAISVKNVSRCDVRHNSLEAIDKSKILNNVISQISHLKIRFSEKLHEMNQMFTFADSLWHIFSNGMVFILGLWLAIKLSKFFKVSQRRSSLLYLWHTLFCIIYLYTSIKNPADSNNYYQISISYYAFPQFGTTSVYFLTSIFSRILNFSYGGVFLFYNILGFVGMLSFASALGEVTRRHDKISKMAALIVIVLPGLSFWSSAIGKDAISFFGSGLAVWAVLDLSRRYPALIISILAFLVVRPHISAIMLVSTIIPIIINGNFGVIQKILLAFVTLPAAVYGTFFALEFVGLGLEASSADVAEYLVKRQGSNLDGGSSIDIANMSGFARLLTYLLRPLFFDAAGMFGIISSVENLIILLILLSALILKLRGRTSQLGIFTVLFLVTFSVTSWLVLANTTANLGIATRQKWMFLPMLLLLAFSYRANRK